MINRQSYPTDLTDREWDVLKSLFPTQSSGRPRKWSIREILNAIFYLNKGGLQWRMVPHNFPPWQSVYTQFWRWSNWHGCAVGVQLNRASRSSIAKA
jgi:transposase